MSKAKPGRRDTLAAWDRRTVNLAVTPVLALEATVSGSDAMVWGHFPHGADIGVRGIGATRSQAFEQAALALTAVIADPARVAADTMIEIRCWSPDDELLFADWLNALIFEMATRNMLFGRFAVSLRDHTLEAKAWGEPLDRSRHRPAVEVKGATYTALSVTQHDDGSWVAQCVVDV
jgi:SHS2 domain-containing protein